MLRLQTFSAPSSSFIKKPENTTLIFTQPIQTKSLVTHFPWAHEASKAKELCVFWLLTAGAAYQENSLYSICDEYKSKLMRKYLSTTFCVFRRKIRH